MIYVFDSCALIDMFNHYYRGRFPTLWGRFDEMVADRALISVREVYKEISEYGDGLAVWSKAHVDLFEVPSQREYATVSQILAVPRFQSLVPIKSRLQGKPSADPFLVAKAEAVNGCLITRESKKPEAVRIPAVCQHFGISCLSLEGFMEAEHWEF